MPDDGRAFYSNVLRSGYRQPPTYSQYGGRGDTLGDLMARRGELEGYRARSNADIWSGAIQQATQPLVEHFQAKAQAEEMAKRDAATVALIEKWDGQDPVQLYTGLYKIRPQDAREYTNNILALRKGPQKDPEAEIARFAKTGRWIAKQPDDVIARGWPFIKQSLGPTAMKVFETDQIPDQWDPKFRPLLETAGSILAPEEEAEVGILPPGSVAFDKKTGRIIAKGEAKPQEKYKVTVPGPGGVPMAALKTEEEMAAGVQEYREPRAPREPKEDARQWVLRNGEAVRVTENEIQPGDQPYSARNTTEKDTSGGKVSKVLEAIDTLSKKINTGSGPGARLAGVIRGRTAGLNVDADVQEYNSLVAGFTPMVARAVGHTGVLTQQDVDSVRMLFPSPGDSGEVRDRKMAQLQRLMGNEAGGGPTPRGPIRPIPDRPQAPKAGDVVRGYRYKGGDPASPSSWQKVQ